MKCFNLNQQASGIEELVVYLESEIWEEGLAKYERQKIWQFHEVSFYYVVVVAIFMEMYPANLHIPDEIWGNPYLTRQQ